MVKSNTVTCLWSLSILLPLLMSCSSSTKALEKGNYDVAIKLAYREYTKDPQSQQAAQNIRIASDTISQRAMANATLYEDEEIKVWKKKRASLYHWMEVVGKYNVVTNGLVSESYDQMCDAKYEVDIAIVDYYYRYGVDLLHEGIATGDRGLARDAYSEFKSSEREEARLFYHDLDSLYQECIAYGAILVEMPSDVATDDIFIKAWDADYVNGPDCSVTIRKERVDLVIDRSLETIEHTKDIVVGREEIRDTAGVVIRYEEIEEEVFAYEQIEEIVMTASANIYVNVTRNTEDCYLESYTKCITEEDVCENIKWTGHKEARKFKSDKSCNEFFMENDLIRDVKQAMNKTIWIY